MDYVHPIDMWTNVNDLGEPVTIFDMGQNMVGWCILSLSNLTNTAGSTVSLRHAEVLQLDPLTHTPPPHTNIYRGNLSDSAGHAYQIETYILNTNADQLLQPHFTYHGFRYVEVAAPSSITANLSTNSLLGCVIHSKVQFAGSLACYGNDPVNTNANWVFASDLINKLLSNAFWSLRGNLQGAFTACTQRNEREGYLYDEHLFSQTACFYADMGAFLTKWIRDFRDDQADTGAYPVYAPLDNNPLIYGGYGDPASQAGGLVLPWRMYENYGDTRILSEHYSSATNWIRYLTNFCAVPYGSWQTAVWDNDYRAASIGDWQCGDMMGSNPSGWANLGGQAGGSRTNLGTAWSAYSCDLAASISAVLKARAISAGDSVSAATYGERYNYFTNTAAAVRQAFTNKIVHYYPGTNTISGIGTNNSQSDCLSALHLNMIPEDQRLRVVTNLLLAAYPGISNYNKYCTDPSVVCSNHLSTGYIFNSRGLMELTRAGYTWKSKQLLLDTNFPSWLYPVVNGATTCWEAWNTYLPGPGAGRGYIATYDSFNHLPFGSVSEWIWRVIGGINPDEENPGFANVIIKPEPGGGFTNAVCSYASIHGPIGCSWTYNSASNQYDLNLTNSANITASVYIPSTNNLADITENFLTNGQAATNTPGVLGFYLTNAPSFTNGATVLRVGSGIYHFKLVNVAL